MESKMNLNNNTSAEAALLLHYAQMLSKASTSKSETEIILALDANLKLWVEIETMLKGKKTSLAKDVQDNLLSLSKFIERLTLSKGLKMTKKDFDCLVNINMQISEGLMQSAINQKATEEAFSLLKCAIDLSNARDKGDEREFVTALDNNLKLWVYIKTAAKDKNNPMPKETKNNLLKLAEYVSGKTLEMGTNLKKINDKVLDTFIQTNLQISEGLITYKTSKVAAE